MSDQEKRREKRPRGRPPAYDRDEALGQAGDAFWRSGYSSTTLDGLSVATGMNRPSLYGAFGDKHAIYLETLARYATASLERLESFLVQDLPLRAQLQEAFDGAIAIYLGGADGARGCFLIGTALSEAVADATIRERLRGGLENLDRSFERRFERAKAAGELSTDADPRALALVAGGMLNAIAVRARAGASRESLRRTARQTVALICG